jgi:hypothetical protein
MAIRFALLALFIGVISICSAAAQNQLNDAIMDAAASAAVNREAPEVIGLRRQIHQHPELANREVETSKIVAGKLRSLSLDVRTGIAHTGVVGTLTGSQPGPVIAVRAELDALQVTEDSPYPSDPRCARPVTGRTLAWPTPVATTFISLRFWASLPYWPRCAHNFRAR